MSRIIDHARVVGLTTWTKVSGRDAQTLRLLVARGRRGFTSGEASEAGWARRTSAYIHRLRELGFPIESISETAGEARVARYRLTAEVEFRGWHGYPECVPF